MESMTIEQQIKNKNIHELASFLFDFYVGFNCENIEGLCDSKPCDQCKDSCVGCIEEWLHIEQILNVNR